jgi:hypothetical protein
LEEFFGFWLDVFLKNLGEFGEFEICDLWNVNSVTSLLGLRTYTSN